MLTAGSCSTSATAREIGACAGAGLVSVMLCAGGLLIVGCGADSAALFFEESHWEVVKKIKGTPVIFLSYSFSRDSESLATAGLDGKLRVYSATTGELRAEWEAKQKGVSKATYSPDGRLLATVGHAPAVKVWDARTQALIAFSDRPELRTGAVSWAPESRRLLAVTHSTPVGEIVVLDALTIQNLAAGGMVIPKGDHVPTFPPRYGGWHGHPEG